MQIDQSSPDLAKRKRETVKCSLPAHLFLQEQKNHETNEVLPGFDYSTISFGLILVDIREPYTGVARSFQYRTDRAVLLKIWNDNHSGSQVRGSNTKCLVRLIGLHIIEPMKGVSRDAI